MLQYGNVPAFKPNERVECEAMIEETRAMLASAGGRDIGRIVANLGLACRHANDHDEDPRKAKAHREAAAALMVRYLIGYPLDILERAADEWIKTKVFFPAIAELRALCEPEYQRRQTAIRFMERALKRSDEKAREAEQKAKIDAERADPEKRAEIDRRLREAQAALATSKAQPKIRPRYVELPDEKREAAFTNVRAGKIGR